MNYEFKLYCTFSVPLEHVDDDDPEYDTKMQDQQETIDNIIYDAIYKAMDHVGGEVMDIEHK